MQLKCINNLEFKYFFFFKMKLCMHILIIVEYFFDYSEYLAHFPSNLKICNSFLSRNTAKTLKYVNFWIKINVAHHILAWEEGQNLVLYTTHLVTFDWSDMWAEIIYSFPLGLITIYFCKYISLLARSEGKYF